MKTLRKAGLLAGILVCGLCVAAPYAVAGPTEVVANEVKLTATVQDLDQNKREFKLKGPDGNTLTLRVSPEVKGFEKVKIGDRVQVSYLQSVAISLQDAGSLQDMKAAAPAPAVAETVQVATPKNPKPEICAVKTDIVASTVEAVDQKKRIVTLLAPDGNRVKLKAGEDMPQFEQLKPGDKILAQYTEALAIKVRKVTAS
jgi:hypothetical protein